jgi:DNA polymerase III alpha subunit (gram-positive type)
MLGEKAEDKVVQFMFLDGDTMEFCSSFVNPERPISPKTIKLNGITSLDVETYKPFSSYLPDIIDFIGTEENVYLVAHNGDGFDKPILLQEMRKNHFDIPENWFFIDTLKLARKFLPELSNHKMDTLRKHFDISTKYSHLATKDVCDLQIIYEHLVGDRNPEEVYQTCRNISKIMSFGKHRGKHLSDIPSDYINYMTTNQIIAPFKNPDLYEELKRLNRI